MTKTGKTPLSGTERQRRYRASRSLVSIDIGQKTAAALGLLRARTSMTTDALVAASLVALASKLDEEARQDAPPSRRSGTGRLPRSTGSVAAAPSSKSEPSRPKSPRKENAGVARSRKSTASVAPHGGTKKTRSSRSAERGDAPRKPTSQSDGDPQLQGILDLRDDRES
jgi:hypothetical protein